MKFIRILQVVGFIIFPIVILLLCLKGNWGNPNPQDLLTPYWRENGPFELSPERGRFALTYTIIETGSVHFPVDIARFVIPDVGYTNNHYVSLFAPGLSFILSIGYFLGKLVGASQLGSTAIIALFATINYFLIYKLCRSFYIKKPAAIISSIVFLFATPAFTYSVSLYQHHLTTTIALISLYLIKDIKKVSNVFIIFLLYSYAVLTDYPNLFLLSPIIIYTCFSFLKIKSEKNLLKIGINFKPIVGIVGAIIPLVLFLGFNYLSYGSPLKMLGSSSILSVENIGTKGEAIPFNRNLTLNNGKSSDVGGGLLFFKTRNMLGGLFTLVFSQDRGILFFTPIMLVGLIGIYFAYKSQRTYTQLLFSLILLNLLLYCLWGDPWGGWAFGTRYLIPLFAYISIFLGFLLNKISKKIIYLIPIFVICVYSITVNATGALSTIAIPPKVQVLALEKITGKQERYSFDRSYEYLKNTSKSYVYQSFAKGKISSLNYFYLILLLIITPTLFQTIKLIKEND